MFLHEDLTKQIINAYYKVYNTLGYGFLEKVYENAFFIELKKRGFKVEKQTRIDVFYEGENVGEFYTDLIVNDLVILELKAISNIIPENEAQLINYLKASKIEVGFIFNFGKTPEFKRLILTNNEKDSLPK